MVVLLLLTLLLTGCVVTEQEYKIYVPIYQNGISQPSFGVGSTYGDCEKIIRLEVEWVYNWAANPPECWGVESVGMIWDERTIGTTFPASVGTVLWFNEPDIETQANLSVEEAAQLWNQNIANYSQYRNGSPAVNHLEWLSDWLEQVDILPDFLCVHPYTTEVTPALARREFVAYLDEVDLLAASYNLPIWITEYAWVTNHLGQAEFISWSKREIAARPAIERAAWFEDYYRGTEPWACFPNTSLVEAGGQLNELGIAYRGRMH